MSSAKAFLVIAIVVVATGCPNEQLRTSILHMNEGIKTFESGSYKTAARHFDEATRAYPDNHSAWYYQGLAHREIKDWDSAAGAFDEAVKLKKDEPMYQMLLGIALYEGDKLDLAESSLERAVELEPRLYQAQWYLGSVYADTDRPEQAAQAWSRAAMLNPQWGRPFVSLGKLYLLWDMVSEAISVLEQGKLHADREHLPDVYYYLGLAYDAQKNWDKAIAAYSKSIDTAREMNRDNIEAKFQRGLAYIKKGDNGNAKEDMDDVANGSADAYTKQKANEVLSMLMTAQ